MKKIAYTLISICVLIAFFNFLKYPEEQCTTLQYQLKNDIKNRNITAIEYFEKTYYSENRDLFNDNFETYLNAVKESVTATSTIETAETLSTGIPTESKSEHTLTDLNFFEITAYCACQKCCGKTDKITRSGKTAMQGRTIAVDPTIIPLGTKVHIDGIGIRIAEDTGGKIKGRKIDIYFEKHEDALKWGVQTREVTILN